MENLGYELDLENSKIDYIPATQKRNFKYALKWVLENNWYDCKVNRTDFSFDFDKMEVTIIGIGYNNITTYKLKKTEDK